MNCKINKETLDQIKDALEFAAAMEHSILLCNYGEDVQKTFCKKNYKLFTKSSNIFYQKLDTLVKELEQQATELEADNHERLCQKTTDDQIDDDEKLSNDLNNKKILRRQILRNNQLNHY